MFVYQNERSRKRVKEEDTSPKETSRHRAVQPTIQPVESRPRPVQSQPVQPQIERNAKMEEEARREDLTVFVGSLPLRATEEDIYKFFKEVA